ncbi:MAG: hypothetical protein AAFY26_08230 [Cyanobacteria bacterium J06638_22]
MFEYQVKEPEVEDFLRKNEYVIATPKPSDAWNCNQLREFGMVGLYHSRVKNERGRQETIKGLNQVFEPGSVLGLLIKQGEVSKAT